MPKTMDFKTAIISQFREYYLKECICGRIPAIDADTVREINDDVTEEYIEGFIITCRYCQLGMWGRTLKQAATDWNSFIDANRNSIPDKADSRKINRELNKIEQNALNTEIKQ